MPAICSIFPHDSRYCDRDLTPAKTIVINRIAQKIAANRINFRYVDISVSYKTCKTVLGKFLLIL